LHQDFRSRAERGISFFLQQKKETKNADAANSLRVCFCSQGKQTKSPTSFHPVFGEGKNA
jgi:hypothetical protein